MLQLTVLKGVAGTFEEKFDRIINCAATIRVSRSIHEYKVACMFWVYSLEGALK